MTIKEAVIKVLRAGEHTMTVDEIYNRIIEQGLYIFRAQNPINVVRTTIECACENSVYANKASVPCFRFQKNNDGKRVYSLLEIQKPQVYTTDSIWNYKVREKFQEWLEGENYAQKTADNYRRAVSQIFSNYTDLMYQAINDSNNELDAIQKCIVSLSKNNNFLDANRSRHNQFTAALSALERFYASGYMAFKSEESDSICQRPDMASFSISSLCDIVDMNEGCTGIKNILQVHFQALYGYSNITILWGAAKDTLSMFLNDNAINSADDLWRFLQDALPHEYVLSNPHIWRAPPNHPKSYTGVVMNLARHFGGTVTRDQIDDYFYHIKQKPPMNAAIIRQGLLIFYASKHFILTEVVNLTTDRCEAITKLLDGLFDNENTSYIVIRDISDQWFSALPIIGDIPWTALLLQEILRLRPDIGYRVIFPGLDGQALDTLGAAIVPSKSGITTFADVAYQYCHEHNLVSKKMNVEELRLLLRDAGMIEGNELIYNLHRALKDYRFAFTDENRIVKILEQ